MAAEEEKRRSYLVVRSDGLIIHTRPVTDYEVWWLGVLAYYDIESRDARARYLSEWGSVLDVSGYVERLEQQLRQQGYNPYYGVTGAYKDPDEFAEKVSWLLRGLPPGARQTLRELLDRVEEFLRRPVEPRPIDAPVRYLERPYGHFEPDPHGGARTFPKSDWHAFVYHDLWYYGITMFRDSFLMWRQQVIGTARTPRGYVWAILVRRDAADRDLVAAVASDDAVREFLGENASHLEEVIRENEERMRREGYDDVVRKAKIVLTTAELLTAGHR